MLPHIVSGFGSRSRLLLLVALLVALSTVPATIPVARAAGQAHKPITIIGNSGFTTANGVTGGTGTASDPYLIQGWNITLCFNCYSPEIGISITNTTAYFRISDVGVSSSTAQAASGILFENVTNGRIDASLVNIAAADPYSHPILIASSRNIVVNADNEYGGGGSGGSNCSTYDTVDVSDSTNVTVSGNTIDQTESGSDLGVTGSSNVAVLNNSVLMDGAVFYGSPCSPSNGIVISSSPSIHISQNNIRNNACGEAIILAGSANGQIVANNVTGYSCGTMLPPSSGIILKSATGALIYHNNLVGNTIQASDNNPGKNQWDNGYPSGGNYWSDYTGVDNCSGPRQDMCPSPDGIGDTPYVFNNAQDRYPLITPFGPGDPISVSGTSLPVNGLALAAPYIVLGLVGSVAVTLTLTVRRARGKDISSFRSRFWRFLTRGPYLARSGDE